jgi:hypothetical protein
MSAALAEVLLVCKCLRLPIVEDRLCRRFLQLELSAHFLNSRSLLFET